MLHDNNRLEVILKISERCNINCTYCYYINGSNKSYTKNSATIPLGVIHQLSDFLTAAISDYALDTIQIDFHGGEPLLLKRDKFEEICKQIEAAVVPYNVELNFSLQTNGLLLDQAWADIIRRYRIFPGISLDGDSIVNDAHRVDKKGKGTYKDVVDGIRLLQNRSIEFAILCVITRHHPPANALAHFVDELGVRNVHFLLPDQTHDEFDPADQAIYAKYLIELFDEWVKYAAKGVKIRLFSKIVGLLASNKRDILQYRKNKKSNKVITISSNGEIGPDDDLRNIETALFSGGGNNLRNTSLKTVLNSSSFSELSKKTEALPSVCTSCGWVNICGAGIIVGGPVQRYSRAMGYGNPSVYCGAIQSLLLHVSKRLQSNGLSANIIIENLQ